MEKPFASISSTNPSGKLNLPNALDSEFPGGHNRDHNVWRFRDQLTLPDPTWDGRPATTSRHGCREEASPPLQILNLGRRCKHGNDIGVGPDGLLLGLMGFEAPRPRPGLADLTTTPEEVRPDRGCIQRAAGLSRLATHLLSRFEKVVRDRYRCLHGMSITSNTDHFCQVRHPSFSRR